MLSALMFRAVSAGPYCPEMFDDTFEEASVDSEDITDAYMDYDTHTEDEAEMDNCNNVGGLIPYGYPGAL